MVTTASKKQAKSNGKGGYVRNAEGKAVKAEVGQLIPLTVFKRVSGSGKAGFSGQMVDPTTGKRYQVIMAVEIGS